MYGLGFRVQGLRSHPSPQPLIQILPHLNLSNLTHALELLTEVVYVFRFCSAIQEEAAAWRRVKEMGEEKMREVEKRNEAARRQEERRREEEKQREEETRRIEEEKRRDENMRRVLGRLMRGKTLVVFMTWHLQATEQRRMRVACSRIVYKMKNRGLDAAFVTWCDHVDQQKMERAEEQQREEQRRRECLIGEGDNLLDGIAPTLARTFDVVLGTNLQAEMADIAMRRKAVVTPEKKLLLARLHEEAYREQQGSNSCSSTLSFAGPTSTSGSLACSCV